MNNRILSIASPKFCVGYALLILLITSACEKPRPAYVEGIPDINLYSYLTTHDWNGVVNDTLVAETWYDPSHNEALIRQFGSVLDIGNGNVWVSDQMKGTILEFDQKGTFVRNVFSAGRGPSEFVRPVSMAMNKTSGSKDVYVLDDGQKMIAKVSLDGVELQRFFFKEMPYMFNGNKLSVLGDNEFMWPTFNQDYALSSRDTLDQILANRVKLVIPRGYNPIVHNNLEYDIKDTAFLYAYQGIPLIFVAIDNQRIVINLEPDKNLEEVGTPITLLPATDSSVSVQFLIRGVALFDDHILVISKISLYRIPLDRSKSITVSSFIDETGQKVAFHPAYFTGQSLFMANYQSGKIYRLRL